MPEIVHPSAPPRTGFRPDQCEAAPLLSGYLIAESAGAVSVRVSEGTWTFDRADVLDIDPLGADAPGADIPRTDPATGQGGRPVRVRVRAGATADFTRRLRIDLTERPMTLAQQHSPARGDDQLARQTERWARSLHLSGTGAAMTRSHTLSYAGSLDAMACDSLD
ncbi:hypothetical protein ABIA39_005789 [Nocardia sp. GAS34]